MAAVCQKKFRSEREKIVLCAPGNLEMYIVLLFFRLRPVDFILSLEISSHKSRNFKPHVTWQKSEANLPCRDVQQRGVVLFEFGLEAGFLRLGKGCRMSGSSHYTMSTQWSTCLSNFKLFFLTKKIKYFLPLNMIILLAWLAQELQTNCCLISLIFDQSKNNCLSVS